MPPYHRLFRRGSLSQDATIPLGFARTKGRTWLSKGCFSTLRSTGQSRRAESSTKKATSEPHVRDRQGSVELRKGDVVVAKLGPNEVFGERALIDQLPRNLNAVATQRRRSQRSTRVSSCSWSTRPPRSLSRSWGLWRAVSGITTSSSVALAHGTSRRRPPDSRPRRADRRTARS